VSEDNDGGPGAGGGQGLGGYLGRLGVIARAGHLEYDRILFFTDAVFAIAITLLVVDLPAHIKHNPAPPHNVIINWEGIVGFAISFAVIALFWMAHHSLFRFVTAFDGTLIRLNLLFIGMIAFLPYPTALLSDASSSQQSVVIFYAACAGGAGLFEASAWFWANRAGLVTGVDPRTGRLVMLRAWLTPAVFGASILIALAHAPKAAVYFWLAIVAFGWIINRAYGRRGEDRADPVDPEDPSPPDPPSPAGPAAASG
jgi:uncharacterized membrane protein